ncbi:glycerate kinase family protein [Sedimentibacter sp. MB31-C6]|uniref:glycerate kinase family protein n=1 Tax=Sedimentibacter sp. MB31-C6 TaxID=3109366 RepID=UPI002DDD6C53|nr:glycerate kinase [Sedimentibacter sp. MB36-C1]WSI02915.1 glycerate kinase [Sedimentibacter sp. MB36-C1]
MKKAVLIPDSFKGTLSSGLICSIIAEKIKMYFPKCEIVSIPVADGGEGSVDCFLKALGGEKLYETVKNPYFEDMQAFYGLIDNGKTAVIEMASCAGLPLVEDRKNPTKTTTYGVGQLILAAAERGCKKIIVGLGGSSTNDGGTGAAAAIGVKFYDNKGNEFIPVGGTLKDIVKIDLSERSKIIENIEIITMCDIDNPMYGESGAAYIFGPQKGADAETVVELDNGLINLCEVINKDMAVDLKDVPGGGAAGAMGAGMIAFFNSKLKMGIETVLETVKFDNIISDADMIFTGEGKIDSQSLRGKVVIGVAKQAKNKNIPVTVIVGGADNDIDEAYEIGVTSIFTINRLPQDFQISKLKSKENLEVTADNIMRLIKSVK